MCSSDLVAVDIGSVFSTLSVTGEVDTSSVTFTSSPKLLQPEQIRVNGRKSAKININFLIKGSFFDQGINFW